MIHLYSPKNTNFSANGDAILLPSSASVTPVLGDAWTATLAHPIDEEGRWRYICEDAVVKMPSFNGLQLFRIRKIHKNDYEVTADMTPIFYDSRDDMFVVGKVFTSQPAQSVLNALYKEKYSASTDITDSRTVTYDRVNGMEILNGDSDNAFTSIYGGEPIYDNFHVYLNRRAGADEGKEIRYGKNLQENGMDVDVDMTDVVTRIYPTAYNDYAMTGTQYVDSPLIDHYAIVHTRTIQYDDVKMKVDASDDDAENGVIICNTQEDLNTALRMKCEQEYANGIDKPKISIDANMIMLQNTEQYKDVKSLETVTLGDTVHCVNRNINVISDARVIQLTYDSIEKTVESVVLGDHKEVFYQTIGNSWDLSNSALRMAGNAVQETRGYGSESQNAIKKTNENLESTKTNLQQQIDDMKKEIEALKGGTS